MAYPHDHCAGVRCYLIQDWLNTNLGAGFPALHAMTLGPLSDTTFLDVITSLNEYLRTPRPILIEDVKRLAARNNPGGTNDYIRSGSPAGALPYKEILWTQIKDTSVWDVDVVKVSNACAANGIYLPHMHVREEDRIDIRLFFEGEGVWIRPELGPFMNKKLLIPLGDTTTIGERSLFWYFTNPRSLLNNEAKGYMLEAKRLGILRPHPEKKLAVLPRAVPMGTEPGANCGEPGSGWGGGPNGKCCDGVTPCAKGLLGQYCGEDGAGHCNAMSDPC